MDDSFLWGQRTVFEVALVTDSIRELRALDYVNDSQNQNGEYSIDSTS